MKIQLSEIVFKFNYLFLRLSLKFSSAIDQFIILRHFKYIDKTIGFFCTETYDLFIKFKL